MLLGVRLYLIVRFVINRQHVWVHANIAFVSKHTKQEESTELEKYLFPQQIKKRLAVAFFICCYRPTISSFVCANAPCPTSMQRVQCSCKATCVTSSQAINSYVHLLYSLHLNSGFIWLLSVVCTVHCTMVLFPLENIFDWKRLVPDTLDQNIYGATDARCTPLELVTKRNADWIKTKLQDPCVFVVC